jgi:hypothetical protein
VYTLFDICVQTCPVLLSRQMFSMNAATNALRYAGAPAAVMTAALIRASSDSKNNSNGLSAPEKQSPVRAPLPVIPGVLHGSVCSGNPGDSGDFPDGDGLDIVDSIAPIFAEVNIVEFSEEVYNQVIAAQ